MIADIVKAIQDELDDARSGNDIFRFEREKVASGLLSGLAKAYRKEIVDEYDELSAQLGDFNFWRSSHPMWPWEKRKADRQYAEMKARYEALAEIVYGS